MPGRLIVHAIEAADLSQGPGLTPEVAAAVGPVASAIPRRPPRRPLLTCGLSGTREPATRRQLLSAADGVEGVARRRGQHRGRRHAGQERAASVRLQHQAGTSVGGRAGFRPYARLKAGASLGNEHERSGLRPHA